MRLPATLGARILRAATVRERSSRKRSFPMRSRRPDSGFAMLLVFLMASIVAIMLYMEVPRIAFETQRQKEQMLVERGQQYKRAIQLFLRANNNQRWPASMDELESFNGKRFLRHRFKDPMTGKDQWRLIHIQNGVLTDSVNNKPKTGDQKNAKDALEGQTIGNYGSSVGSYEASQNAGTLNVAQRRRTSDTAVAGGAGAPTSPGGTQSSGQQVPGQTGAQPNVPGVPGVPGLPGQGITPGSGAAPPVFPGQIPGQIPGQTNAGNAAGSQSSGSSVGDYSSFGSTPTAGQQSGAAGQMGTQPGQYPGMPGPPANSQNFGGTPAYPGAPGMQGNAGGFQQPGMQIPGQSSGATSMINNLLTSPRPGGMAGLGSQNNVIGGGIAGVASTVDGDSIMVYNDHTNYSEWEFIFDPAKQHYPPPNPVGGAVGTPAGQMGSMGGSTPGTPASQMGTGPGSTFGTPGASGTPGTSGTPTSPFGAGGADPDLRGGRQ